MSTMINKTASKAVEILNNKHTRSTIFLIITVIIIFAINSVLPTIEGRTHYTADPITITYQEYQALKADNENYNLTWSSEESINKYIKSYREQNGLSEYTVVEIPKDFTVTVYTKFFFQHTFWYISTLTRTVSAILLFYAMFNYLITRCKDLHKRYIDLSNEMITFSNNSLDPSTFEPWMVNIFNHDRKVAQHITNIKYRLNKLDQRTNYKIKVLAKTDPDNPKCSKYINARRDLQDQLDLKYIEDVISHKSVKHFKYIHPSFVLCGVNKIGVTTDSYSLIQSDSTRLSKDMIIKTLLATSLTVMFATLLTITVVTAADKPWYWIIIDILTTITPLVIQIFLAYDYCNTYMEEHLIPNLLNRRTIALMYLADLKKGVNAYEKNITTD